MADDHGLHALMTYWVKREREFEAQRTAALEDGKRWFKRAKLAADQGELELANEAKRRAQLAHAKYQEAGTRLQEVAAEKAKLQHEAFSPSPAATLRAHKLLADFREMGIDPRFEELEEALEKAGAEEALAQLRARMGES